MEGLQIIDWGYILVCTILLFYGGASIGSFLGVLLEAGREGERKRIITGRSKCNHCKKELSLHELIPIVSFAVQKGCCRGCGLQIPHIYFRIELVFGLLTVAAVYIRTIAYGLPRQEVLFRLGVLRCFLAISISDIRRYELPLSVWIGGLIRTAVWYGLYYKDLRAQNLATQGEYGRFVIVQFVAICVGIAGIMYLLSHIIVYQKTKLRQAGMGAGDIVLMIRLSLLWFFLPSQSGLMLSYHTAQATVGELLPTRLVDIQFAFLRYVCASAVGIGIRVVMKLCTKRNLLIPFLPALILGFLMMIELGGFWSIILQ